MDRRAGPSPPPGRHRARFFRHRPLPARQHAAGTLPGLLRASLLRGLAVAPPPFDCPPMPMYMVWHLRHQADPMHQWLRQELQAVVAPALAAAELRPATPKAA